MNIAVNARVLLPSHPEGVARYIFETTRAMAEAHPEDNFYMFFDRKPDARFLVAKNMIPVIIPPQARHPILYKIWFDWMLPYFFKKYNIDVFYSGDSFLSLTANVKTVMVSHDLAYIHYPEHIPSTALKYYQKYFPKFHKRADHLITVSEFVKKDIATQYNIKDSKITVAHNALPDIFQQKTNSDHKIIRDKYAGGQEYFLCVASIHPRKNTVGLIKAFDRYKKESNSPTKLVLVGRKSWNTGTFEETLNASPYRSDIIHLEGIGAEVKDIMAAAKCLFYVSLFEGFGIPILEGFASQIPVVTSNVSSMPEVAGNAAILVDPNNIIAIAKAMNDLNHNHLLRKTYIAKGLERVNHFSWKRSGEIIYEQLKTTFS